MPSHDKEPIHVNDTLLQPGTYLQTPRIKVLDALRGFAVFGILMMNVRVFSGYSFAPDETTGQLMLARWDYIFNWLHIVFFNGKFYTLFSLLFGISFAIQMQKGTNRQRSFTHHFARRLFFLLLIGIIHLWGIWFSDIVSLYAVCGYLLLLFRGFSEKNLIKISALLLLIPGLHSLYLHATDGGYTTTIYQWLSQAWINADLPRTSYDDEMFNLQSVTKVIHQGSLATVAKFNSIGPLLRLYLLSYDARLFRVLAVFIIGMWAGRQIINNNLHKNKQFLKKTTLIGWVIGLPLNIFFVMGHLLPISEESFLILRSTLSPFGFLLLSLGYATTLMLIFQTRYYRILTFLFDSVGKLTLTNYILQSLAGIFLFYSIGIGLGEYFGSTLLTFSVFLIFATQILLSNLWLKYFSFGPLEWLWRCLTYGKVIVNRKNPD